jgi:hypothetical protein
VGGEGDLDGIGRGLDVLVGGVALGGGLVDDLRLGPLGDLLDHHRRRRACEWRR